MFFMTKYDRMTDFVGFQRISACQKGLFPAKNVNQNTRLDWAPQVEFLTNMGIIETP
jgi:hypothetical protein